MPRTSLASVARRWRRDPITRGWAIVSGAELGRLGLGLVASLAIARGLGPAAFGTYAVLAATVGVVGGLAEGGLTESAVLRLSAARTTDEAIARRAAGAFFWLRLGLAAVVVGVGWLLAGPVSRVVLDTDVGLLRWALLGIVATAASGATSAILQSIRAFGRMSWLTLANTGLTAVLALVLALLGRLDLVAALVILGIGTSLATFGLGRWLLPREWALTFPGWTTLVTEARHLLRTGRWLWLAGVFAMLTANGEVLLLNRWVDLPMVGAYALASNLASKASVVNHSLYTVLLPGVAAVREPAALKGFVRRGFTRSALIGIGLLALIPLSGPLVELVYGSAFASAVDLLRLLVGVMILDVLLTPLLLLPLALHKPRLLAAADAARAFTLFGVALVTVPVFGAPGAVAARLAARIAGATLVLGALWLERRARPGWQSLRPYV